MGISTAICQASIGKYSAVTLQSCTQPMAILILFEVSGLLSRLWRIWRYRAAGVSSSSPGYFSFWKGALLQPECYPSTEQHRSFLFQHCLCCAPARCDKHAIQWSVCSLIPCIPVPSLQPGKQCARSTLCIWRLWPGRKPCCTWIQCLWAERQRNSIWPIALWRVWSADRVWAERLPARAFAGLWRLWPGSIYSARLWHPSNPW